MAVFVLLLLPAGFAGCGQSHPVVLAATTPDFLKTLSANPRWRAYRLHSFQVQHLWSGIGHPAENGTDYRAKVVVWQYTADQSPAVIAELYFHDPERFEPAGRDRNPDPNTAGGGPFQLHFPVVALGPIIATLRAANDPVYLYFYDNQWSVGIPGAELVGSE